MVLGISMSGCGTMANLEGKNLPLIDSGGIEQPKPFGGVGRDIRWISSGNVYFCIDIPFSLMGDIVTLPRVLKMFPSDQIDNPQVR